MGFCGLPSGAMAYYWEIASLNSGDVKATPWLKAQVSKIGLCSQGERCGVLSLTNNASQSDVSVAHHAEGSRQRCPLSVLLRPPGVA